MKIKFIGNFDGDTEKLPAGEHEPGAVKFKESDDPKKFGIILNIVGVIFLVPLFFFVEAYGDQNPEWWELPVGLIAACIALIPHELLHAVCIPGQTYIYAYLKAGIFFVAGSGRMSKARFVFMSMLPNICFGIIPFIIFLSTHQIWAGVMGAVGLVGGVGDYYNVFNCITQVPRGHRVYNHKFNTYRYDPKAETLKIGEEIGL